MIAIAAIAKPLNFGPLDRQKTHFGTLPEPTPRTAFPARGEGASPFQPPTLRRLLKFCQNDFRVRIVTSFILIPFSRLGTVRIGAQQPDLSLDCHSSDVYH